ncbi:MAG: hypothetical protein NZ807_12595 [Dehalococcoidia bacterium]|nr:hypothetical protein [Dehalococcoidia bacterium]
MTGVKVVFSTADDRQDGRGALVTTSGATPVQHGGADGTQWFRGGTTLGTPPPRHDETSLQVGGAMICGFHDIS